MTSRDDEAAITRLLAEHQGWYFDTTDQGDETWSFCTCGHPLLPMGQEVIEEHHLKHQAAVFAAHMADREADAWDAGHEASDCECGHNIFAHPKDNWRDCRAKDRCGCTGFEPVRNPFRLTPDTEGETDE